MGLGGIPPGPNLSEIRKRLRRGPPQAHPEIEIPPGGASLGTAEKPGGPADFRRTKSESVPGRRLTPGKVLLPSGQVDFTEAEWQSVPGRGLSPGKVLLPSGQVDFTEAEWRSVPGRGLSQRKVRKCARPRTFAVQSPKVCLGRAFFPAGFFAGFFARVFCRDRAGKKASYKREAAYPKRRKNYVASYLDFRRWRSDLCAAGPEKGLGPGRAGKAAAG